jgi:hypothetical protein
MMIEQCIDEYLPTLGVSASQEYYFDTVSRLMACAGRHSWISEDFQTLEFLSKRIEISRCVYEAYLESGARASNEKLSNEWLPLTLLLLFKDFMRLSAQGDNVSAVKRLNATLKLLDVIFAEKVLLAQELISMINMETAKFLEALQPEQSQPTEGLLTAEVVDENAVLPVTVLFWEGPIARAYLATIKSMGLRPEKIIHLVARNDLSTKKPVGRFLPGQMRLVYAQSKQKNSIHHWSAILQKTEMNLYQQIRHTVENSLGFSKSVIDDALGLGELGQYSSDIETLMIDNLADESLYARLAALPESQILFTGGGIVPKKLFGISSLKFIHVHPGYLPKVRGADCALWSQLMMGRTSASCFYMAPGIDDGDVIFSGYLPSMSFNAAIDEIGLKTLYRATYAFFDPWIRSCILRRSLVFTEGFTRVEAYPQSEQSSVTYHFAHEKIQAAALKQLFRGKQGQVI